MVGNPRERPEETGPVDLIVVDLAVPYFPHMTIVRFLDGLDGVRSWIETTSHVLRTTMFTRKSIFGI